MLSVYTVFELILTLVESVGRCVGAVTGLAPKGEHETPKRLVHNVATASQPVPFDGAITLSYASGLNDQGKQDM
jgi:hypothetical protein